MRPRAGRATLGGLMLVVLLAGLPLGLARGVNSPDPVASVTARMVLVGLLPPTLTIAAVWGLGALGLARGDDEPRPGDWRRRQARRTTGGPR